ncbi:hypothetical protein J40TS1_33980 [Paenibacillus montaniterrae]|uniref:DUF2313 domain-containing protein n=1 Tax=Paenibacillus montaniterrae TaxID=429341 RepID=A0A919YUZ1_9BACL|nr:putative phage tail protein [Paenibacillus montaniterrae]GIP17756.1 hypothetical protein J40TS1_33980 [Paenibacillus montaniterrae]
MRKEQIIRSLHKILRSDPFVNDMAGSVGKKLDDTDKEIVVYQEQIDIQKATWAIPLYEYELGIPTDLSKSLADRRAVILAKMRGDSGKIGAEEIKVISDSWTNGNVEVGFSESTIKIKFTSGLGTPENIPDLQEALEAAIPAHLKISFSFRYLLIKEVQAMTIAQMDSTTLDKFAGGVSNG